MRLRSIVLTGGPGSGKTCVGRALVERHPGRYVLVPEAASQVYAQLGVRWDQLDGAGRCDLQRRIYALQLAQEGAAAEAHPGRTLLLDRGTVDGSAYWPGGPADYWTQIGTTHERELGRYDRVFWLECAAAVGQYDGERSNPCRREDPATALALGERIAALWSGHPRFCRIRAGRTLDEKIAAIESILARGDR